mmetsp:Transcript_16627/g.29450  ORF Transcript_16627/g.29450 Transcript_16627/m.29450 type:complete len:470 (-) Transcript_16627:34-1443(-)
MSNGEEDDPSPLLHAASDGNGENDEMSESGTLFSSPPTASRVSKASRIPLRLVGVLIAVSALCLIAAWKKVGVATKAPFKLQHSDTEPYSTPPGTGVDLDMLDQCLEKAVRHFGFGESEEDLDNEFPDVPLLRRSLFEDSRGRNKYVTGSFGSSTTWAISKSKHLAYMLIQKVGSMSFREMTASCDPEKDIPCDVFNSFRRPWRSIDAHPMYARGGGFYANDLPKTPRVPGQWQTVDFKYDFIERFENSVKFTYVSDPIVHFIRGYRQLKKSDGDAAEYKRTFLKMCNSLIEPQVSKTHFNVHFASSMVHLIHAAMEATQIARSRGKDVLYARPFDFIGRLEKGGYTEADWMSIVDMVKERYPESAHMLPTDVASENESGTDPKTPEELAAMKARAKKEKLSTLLRQYIWGVTSEKNAKDLGVYSKVATLPRDFARQLCAAFYADFVCLGHSFPKQCVDENGNYNVDEY